MQLGNALTLQRVLLAGGGLGTEQIMEGGPLAVALTLAASFSLPPSLRDFHFSFLNQSSPTLLQSQLFPHLSEVY